MNNRKELIVDYRKRRVIQFKGAVVEWIESFKFLCVHITKELSWSTHTNTVVKKAFQRLILLERLKRSGMGPQAIYSSGSTLYRLLSFYIYFFTYLLFT